MAAGSDACGLAPARMHRQSTNRVTIKSSQSLLSTVSIPFLSICLAPNHSCHGLGDEYAVIAYRDHLAPHKSMHCTAIGSTCKFLCVCMWVCTLLLATKSRTDKPFNANVAPNQRSRACSGTSLAITARSGVCALMRGFPISFCFACNAQFESVITMRDISCPKNVENAKNSIFPSRIASLYRRFGSFKPPRPDPRLMDQEPQYFTQREREILR